MPTQPYEAAVSKYRSGWDNSVVQSYKKYRAELNAEVTAQQELGAQITSIREAANLSQTQLAKLSGVQQADISRAERGLGNPTRDTLLKLAEALNMQLVFLPRQLEGSVGKH